MISQWLAYLRSASHWSVSCFTGAGHKWKQRNKEEIKMIVLLILALVLGGYLVYALTHPERF